MLRHDKRTGRCAQIRLTTFDSVGKVDDCTLTNRQNRFKKLAEAANLIGACSTSRTSGPETDFTNRVTFGEVQRIILVSWRLATSPQGLATFAASPTTR